MAESRPTRATPTALASTAGALVALVAVAAMMTSTVAATPTTSGQARQTINEGAKVRAAVAAVAAAARKLVESDRLVQALPARWPSLQAIDTAALGIDRSNHAAAPAPRLVLHERLLDLPPPAC